MRETYCKITLQDLEISLPGFKNKFTYLGTVRNHGFFEITPQEEEECLQFLAFNDYERDMNTSLNQDQI